VHRPLHRSRSNQVARTTAFGQIQPAQRQILRELRVTEDRIYLDHGLAAGRSMTPTSDPHRLTSVAEHAVWLPRRAVG
jgi:hypothetical protein